MTLDCHIFTSTANAVLGAFIGRKRRSTVFDYRHSVERKTEAFANARLAQRRVAA